MVGGERFNLALLGLITRRVQVAAEDAMAGRRPGELGEERLARLRLDEPVRRRRRDMRVPDLHLALRALDYDAQHPLRLRGEDSGQGVQLPAARGQIEKAPGCNDLAGVERVHEADPGQRLAPARSRACPDLLKADDVRLASSDALRLAFHDLGPARHVPRQELHGLSLAFVGNMSSIMSMPTAEAADLDVLHDLVARFEPGDIDVPNGSARIRLEDRDGTAADALIEGGIARIVPARMAPDAVLRADPAVWADIARDVRAG